MISASLVDRTRVVNILCEAFADNQSVQFIAGNGRRSSQKIRRLMEYSFDVCFRFGKVYLSANRQACALVLFPHLKKTTLHAVWLNVKLVLLCIGPGNIQKAMVRQAAIKKLQPAGPFCYLWFIGVARQQQGQGIGSNLLRQVINESEAMGLPVCLETSTLKNIPWYQHFGFGIYNTLNLGYELYFLQRNVPH